MCSYQTSRSGPFGTLLRRNMRPLVLFCTAYSLSSHTTALELPNARVGRLLGASSWLGYADISLSISRPTSIRFPTRFISKIYGTPAPSTCLRPSKLALYSPTNPYPYHVTEMVATAVSDCQLNTARRILAEIQLRINGFNTYG